MSKLSKRDTKDNEGPTGVCVGPQLSHRCNEQGSVLLLNLGGRSQTLRASNNLLLFERAAVIQPKLRRVGSVKARSSLERGCKPARRDRIS